MTKRVKLNLQDTILSSFCKGNLRTYYALLHLHVGSFDKDKKKLCKNIVPLMKIMSSLDEDNEDVCKIRNTFRQRRSLPYPRGREWKEGVSLTAGRGICQTSPCILRSWSLERLRGTESRSTGSVNETPPGKREENKHQPGRASCSQQQGCRSISLHFL